MTGERFPANCSKVLVQTPRKPACRSPPDCSVEQRADTDQQTGGYGSASMVLQELECIWVQARARQKETDYVGRRLILNTFRDLAIS